MVMKDLTRILEKHPHLQLGRKQLAYDEARLAFKDATLTKACAGGVIASGLCRMTSLLGCGEIELMLPIVMQKNVKNKRLFIINPPANINSRWLATKGWHHFSPIILTPTNKLEALWCCEQVIRSGIAHTIVYWQESLNIKQARRLQILSAQYHSLLINYNVASTAPTPLPINLDFRLYYGQKKWAIDILKVRGGWPQSGINIDAQHEFSNKAITHAFQQHPFPHSIAG
jgi:protein ImuA